MHSIQYTPLKSIIMYIMYSIQYTPLKTLIMYNIHPWKYLLCTIYTHGNIYYVRYVQLVSPAVYEKHQKKSVKEAEANIKGAFHCKTPDCAGWTVIGKLL